MIRIVKMTFREDALEDFVLLFSRIQSKIKAMPGCEHLALWQDKNQKNIVFTYSIWQHEEALNHYRFSDLFKETWATVKPWFAAKPEAWSVDEIKADA